MKEGGCRGANTLVEVKGKLVKCEEYQLEVPYMYAGASSESIVFRNMEYFNGVRLTVRSNHPLKVKLQMCELAKVS